MVQIKLNYKIFGRIKNEMLIINIRILFAHIQVDSFMLIIPYYVEQHLVINL